MDGNGTKHAATDTRPVGFDDPDFSQLCVLVRDVRALQHGDWSVRARVLRALLRLAPLLRSLTRLPTEALYLSDAPVGQRIRALLPRRLMDARRVVAISTLTLPATFEEYARGRPRQAFRTNCSRAREAGVTVARVDDLECIRQRLLEVFARRNAPEDAAWSIRRAEMREGEFWFAVDLEGGTMAFAEVVVDERVAMLTLMVAGGPGSSEARYLLMAELLRSLTRRGVRQVVVSRALSLSPGLIYFQKLLGFSPKNLKVLTPQTSVRPVSRKVSARARAFRPVGPPR